MFTFSGRSLRILHTNCIECDYYHPRSEGNVFAVHRWWCVSQHVLGHGVVWTGVWAEGVTGGDRVWTGEVCTGGMCGQGYVDMGRWTPLRQPLTGRHAP